MLRLLLCPFGTHMAWSSRAGPRAGPPTLRSANARRRRRGSPRLAARASPLRSSAPWARLASPAPPPRPPWRWPPSLRYACVRRRRPGTARLAARTSPLRGAAAGSRPGGPGSHSRRPPTFSTPLFALAAGWAAAMPTMLPCDHRKGGGDVCRSPGHLRPLRGDGGGDVPPPDKRRAGSALKGKGVGRSPSLSSRMCSVRSTLRNQISSRLG